MTWPAIFVLVVLAGCHGKAAALPDGVECICPIPNASPGVKFLPAAVCWHSSKPEPPKGVGISASATPSELGVPFVWCGDREVPDLHAESLWIGLDEFCRRHERRDLKGSGE